MTAPTITVENPDAPLSDAAITALARLLIHAAEKELQEKENAPPAEADEA